MPPVTSRRRTTSSVFDPGEYLRRLEVVAMVDADFVAERMRVRLAAHHAALFPQLLEHAVPGAVSERPSWIFHCRIHGLGICSVMTDVAKQQSEQQVIDADGVTLLRSLLPASICLFS
jgi:hypothetical protein